MARLACLPMFGRKYKPKNSKPEHLPHSQPTKPVEASLLVSPKRAPSETGLAGAFIVGGVVWGGDVLDCPAVEAVRFDQKSPPSDEDGRTDLLKEAGQPSSVGEVEYEGGDEADRDVGADNLVGSNCELLSDSGHLVSGDRGDDSEKGAQQGYYESPQSMPSGLTEVSPSEIDLQSGHVSDPGTQWRTFQSQREPLPGNQSSRYSETKPCEENDDSGCRLSDCSLTSAQIDPTHVSSCGVVQDHESVAASGEKTVAAMNLSHQGLSSTKSEGSAPAVDNGVFMDVRASNGIISAPTKKPWWKSTLRAHRSLSKPSHLAAGSPPSSPPLESAERPLQSYGSDGDMACGIISPESAELGTHCHAPDAVTDGNPSETGNASHVQSSSRTDYGGTAHSVGGAMKSTPNGLSSYLLSPPQLNGFRGSVLAFPARRRVEEWVNSIDPTSTADDETLPLTDNASANARVTGEAHDDFRVKQHKDLENVQTSTPVDVDMALAVAATRSLQPLATTAQFPGYGFRVVPPLGMFNLKIINLSGNAIVRIPPGCFPKSVHNLDLSRNKIAVIEGLRELTRLRVLNLSANRISRIGHGLANCTSLRELYLGGNKISEVEGLHRLLKLHILDLSYNKLTSSKALNQLAANYLSLQVLNLLGNGVVKDLGEEQLRKFVLGIAPDVIYLNKQRLRSTHSREGHMDSVAKAALGNASGYHAQRGNKSSNKPSKKSSGLQQQLPPGHKRSVSGDPAARNGPGLGQLLKNQGHVTTKRQGHGHHSRHQIEKEAGKGKYSAGSSPVFVPMPGSVPPTVPTVEPVMMRIRSDSALHKHDADPYRYIP